jgi:hypothetical protein
MGEYDDEVQTADSGLSIAEEYDRSDRREAEADETLARLFAVSMVFGREGSIRMVDLAQQARHAGIPEAEIAAAQKHAKEELVKGGDLDV